MSLAEKVRNHRGKVSSPHQHCRAAAPSTTSTTSLMGKGWFSFQVTSGPAGPGCSSGHGLTYGQLGYGHLLGMLLSRGDAHPQLTLVSSCSCSPGMEHNTRHGVTVPWPPPAVSCEQMRWGGCGLCGGAGCSSLGAQAKVSESLDVPAPQGRLAGPPNVPKTQGRAHRYPQVPAQGSRAPKMSL